MTTKNLLSICCFVAVYSLSSCTKDAPQGPPGPPGDTGVYVPLKGDIRGKVIVYDSTGAPLSDYSGVIVTIDSTNMADTTDASGAYSFSQVPAGRYNFSYSKAGYGTYRIIRQLHPGGAQVTQMANADVGQIYVGPPCLGGGPMSIGGPGNHEIFAYAEFSEPMEVPTAVVLYLSVGGPPKTDFVKALRDYHATNFYPTVYAGPVIESTMIYGDSVLVNAHNITFSLAFDNPKDIHYIDEQGRTIYPCTGPFFNSFGLSASAFTPPFEQSRRRNDGIPPLLRNFRLK
ncbi:carboxypeptidase-like regulatory domain-containing protein [Chitinophaga sp. CF418]|uniref:carboxypeptidase-like regulatory domain-containing protein n=1 Tax=Chitinophaga sp. CF418 TaxID=1855287 RepID=UPI000914512F|nr:carboxypeptidase-like regulatory domain-containing protein [Chitinophaga sp. CF418]SHM21834.1 Carboxypeptidase regulatory-like domain-containing protein [Chitinophaga sp. CF418]